ncbi:penicillin-binding transpeptidase domain-containing protein [Enterococcus sp. 669A]|uniref:Penicillin-binding transpeptidase domain-containing protein n=1 Tax=Candidatus Enterococcus moelleringii TaxID=2815325 RepID=A0ABS3LBP3_9ENTE|nr:penicillin-binding transpeptidase domain-containing protein [Enterococcus sp. 669A]MBO1307063.1 penicillin-binding transpeptidase domain-containing protein [Enterococcus sp. 669A]
MQRSQKNQKKSNKLPLIIIGAVILLGIAGFGGYTVYHANQLKNEGEQTVKKFIAAISDGKYNEIPKYLTDASLKDNGFTAETVEEKYQNIFSGINASNIKAKDIQIEKADNGYDFSYTLSLNTGLGALKDQKYSGTLTEDDQKINWTPKLIFPNMDGTDKVSYEVSSATRGEILDRNDQGLAVNGTVYQIGVIPNQLGTGDERAQKIAAIAESIGSTEDAINSALDQGWVQDDFFVPLKTVNTTPESVPEGVEVHQATGRTYPLGEAAAQLIGYVGKVTAEDLEKNDELAAESLIGRTGLERALDKQLRGQDGGLLAIVGEDGTQKKVLQEVRKTDGENVKLTIDAKAQQIAYDSLQGQPGSSVATAPKTGDLLAVVSSPSFDPNKMTNGISQADYDAYNNDENLPFMSRFATGYAPGSTFKTVTAAIGLDAGTLDPNEELAINGLKWQKDSSWGGYQVTRVSDESPVNLRTALVYSDNIYMAQETLKMGEKTFRAGLNKFIFGEKLDLPIAMDPAQISNEDSFNSEVLLADTGYGQGQLLLNPIQQITTYSVFPNNGTLVYPKLIADEETKTKADVVSAGTVDTIKQDMEAVVSDPNGTASSLQSLGIPLAAKTGTAEIKEKQDERGQQNSFLYAFDSQNQGYAVMEFLEDRADGQSATELSKELLTYLQATYQ